MSLAIEDLTPRLERLLRSEIQSSLLRQALILRRMQLLPCEAYLKPKILDPKGKRKVSEDAEDQSPAKKNVFEREAFTMFD